MNILEMYKRLSKEDKSHLTVYCIYDSIYDVARNESTEISDEVAVNIQQLAYDLWLDDEYMNLSATQIAYFLTECYVKDNTFMNKVDDIDYDEILQAVEDDDYDFYKEEEMER